MICSDATGPLNSTTRGGPGLDGSMAEQESRKTAGGGRDRTGESGQALLEYVLAVVMSTVAILLIVAAVTRTLLEYYEMQAIWTSLPLI